MSLPRPPRPGPRVPALVAVSVALALVVAGLYAAGSGHGLAGVVLFVVAAVVVLVADDERPNP